MKKKKKNRFGGNKKKKISACAKIVICARSDVFEFGEVLCEV